MVMLLSRREVQILLGARLMCFGVPFYRTTKPDLFAYEEILEALRSRLIKERNSHFNTRDAGASGGVEADFLEFSLTPEEISGCVITLGACLAECGNDPIDLDLHLATRERQDVDQLLAKFLAARGEEP